MSGMTILISPLNWGFGHAGRMIPLALELKRRGNEVVFGADAALLPLIEGELPGIRLIEIPGINIRYSRWLPQYACIFMQMPKVFLSAVREHRLLKRLAADIKPDVIVSDNRLGFYHRKIFSVYVTHQLCIPFPRLLRFMEPLGTWLHRKIINRYDLCLVPDYPGTVNLSGRLSHGLKVPDNLHYMGPLSRFAGENGTMDLLSPSLAPAEMGQLPYFCTASSPYVKSNAGHPCCILILSGPEPQRTLLFERVREALRGIQLWVLSATPIQDAVSSEPGITLLIKPDTGTMRDLVSSSTIVITRAGYTSVMELVSLGKGAVLIPTPGQTEQEYLGQYLNGRHGFMTVRQSDIGSLGRLIEEWKVDTPQRARAATPDGVPEVDSVVTYLHDDVQEDDPVVTYLHDDVPEDEPVVTCLPDSAPLFEKAVSLLPGKKKNVTPETEFLQRQEAGLQ